MLKWGRVGLRPFSLFLAAVGLTAGLAGQTLMVLSGRCWEGAGRLAEDFKVVAFIQENPPAAGDLEARIAALEGVGSVEFVSKEAAYLRLMEKDPELAASVALLGDNPLSSAFEVRPSLRALGRFSDWFRELSGMAGLSEVRYKPEELRALLAFQFYARLLNLVGGILWVVLAAFLAAVLAPHLGEPDLLPVLRVSGGGALSGAIGGAVGSSLGLVLARPGWDLGFSGSGPPLGELLAMAAAGGLLGGSIRLWGAGLSASGGPERSRTLAALFQEVRSRWTELAALLLVVFGTSAGQGGSAWGEPPAPLRGTDVLGDAALTPSETSPRTAVPRDVSGAPPRAASVSAGQKRRELGRIQGRLTHKRKEIEALKKEEADLRKELSSLDRGRAAALSRLVSLRGRIQKAEERKEGDLRRIGALKAAHLWWRELVSQELDAHLWAWRLDFPHFGTGTLWAESYRRGALLEKVRYLAGLEDLGAETEKSLRTAKREHSQLTASAGALAQEQRLKETSWLKAKEAVEGHRQRYRQSLEELKKLEETTLALSRLIRELETESSRRPSRDVGRLSEPEHSLPWPVEGEPLNRFGKERVANLGTWQVHHGIRIRSSPGASVRAVKGGKVLFSGPFRSYGEMVILDHGSGFYTIYGLLGENLARKGSRLGAGGLLGRAPDKAVVYFEMRRGDRALDPVIWLERRQKKSIE